MTGSQKEVLPNLFFLFLRSVAAVQFAATDAFDLSREPQAIRDEYGTGHFATACLIARRLAERGVRFTQVYYGNGQPWDMRKAVSIALIRVSSAGSCPRAAA